MTKNIIVTTGIYDLIKDHVRRKKVTLEEENRLLAELKGAKQVRRRELPDDVVTVNRRVLILDHSDQQEKEYIFVSYDIHKKLCKAYKEYVGTRIVGICA